jgi:hypothetical protein
VRDRIQAEKAWEETWTALSPRHTEAIPAQTLFMDSIAKEIGCLLSTSDLIRNPRLLLTHWYSAFNQASYRVKGPHSMRDVALEELRSQGPYPFANSFMLAYLMVSSLLPHFVHVKETASRFGTPPGYPSPPKTREPREHPLSRPSATVERRARHIPAGVKATASASPPRPLPSSASL